MMLIAGSVLMARPQQLKRVLAPELNAVCPGMITTRWFVEGMGCETYNKLKNHYESVTQLGTACTAEDVADAVLWLIEGARAVTGELLDSGTHLGTFGCVPARASSVQ